MDLDYADQASTFRAFCDATRLQILALLKSGEKCACVLLERLAVGQSTLSYHMKILVQSGVVNARKEGKWTYYAICKEGSEKAMELLAAITRVTIVANVDIETRCCA